MSKAGRIRTESMIDRLGRKPLAEGYDMWDKDYMLGALRLFQCKLEVAPPFEVAACLDAVGDILASLEEPEEALDHFNQAVAKYDMINKTVLAELMRCKACELEEGRRTEEALERADKALAPYDARLKEGKTGAELAGAEAKGQLPALGRLFLYRAELLGQLGRAKEALPDVEQAIELGCERTHVAHGVKGDLLIELDQGEAAIEAYRKAIKERPCFVPAHRSLARALTAAGCTDEALETLDASMKLHPCAEFVRDKAFLLSNKRSDDEALALLDQAISEPPHEETEALTDATGTVATLRKAKVAVLADLGRFGAAAEELQKVLELDPDDEEAAALRQDVFAAACREAAQKKGAEPPANLEKIIDELLSSKPQATLDDAFAAMA